MGKPNGHLKDVTINQSNGNGLCHLDLNKNLVEDKTLEVLNNNDLKKKGKFPKVETVLGLRNNDGTKSERPRFRRQLSTGQVPDSRLSPCGSKKNNEKGKQEESWLRCKQEPAHGSTPHESKRGHESELIVMSCLNCYLHVMVCDDNPKCPKCRKGDGLLDMYRS